MALRIANVELIRMEIDHKVKYNSAATAPAWNNRTMGRVSGLYIWRIEDFEVVVWPKEKVSQFFDGGSCIVLHFFKVGEKERK